MFRKLLYISSILAFSALAARAITVVSEDASIPKHYVPPVVGNGSICTSIDFEGEQFQKKYRSYYPEVVWAGRRYSRTDNYSALITMGHYKTSITVGGKPLGKPLSWEQKLDRENALIECTVKYAEATVKTTVFVPMGLDMLAVKKVVEPNDKSAKVDVKFTYFLTDADSVKNPPRMVVEKPEKLESPERASIRYTAYGLKVYRGQIQILPSKPSTFEAGKNYASFSTSFDKSPAEISYVALYADNYNTDIAGDIERLANKITKSSGEKVKYSDVVKLSNTARQDEFPESVRDERSAKLLEAAKAGFGGLLEDHKKEWKKFYEEGSKVSIPDKAISDVYLTSLYHMKTVATRWSFPVTIFGHGAGWSGRYFGWDEFYTSVGAMSAGKFDLSERPCVFRRKLLAPAIMRVSYYRAPTFNKIGARYVWETNEDGSEGTTDGLWLDHVFHMSTISATGWKQYLYTGDKKFLKETAYPVMKECALFLLSHMVYNHGGRITIGKCTDIERLGPAVENAFLTSCGAIYSFETAAKAADILGVDAETAKTFRETAAGLRKTLPQNDEMYIPFEGCKEKSIVTICGYFPFPVLSLDDPKGTAAVRDFYKNIYSAGNMVPVGKSVCSWYASWLSSSFSCIGDAKNAYDTAILSMSGVGLFKEPWEILETGNNPWFVSSAGNFIYAFNNLLLHQNEKGEMKVAWAAPESWKDFSFTLPAYGGGKVDVLVKDGKFSKLDYKSAEDSQKTIIFPKRLVPESKNDKSWESDGDFYRVKVSGDFSI